MSETHDGQEEPAVADLTPEQEEAMADWIEILVRMLERSHDETTS